MSRVQFCPECNSKNISTDWSNAGAIGLGYFNELRCNTCGFVAPIFPTQEEEKVGKQKKPKKRNMMNTVLADVFGSAVPSTGLGHIFWALALVVAYIFGGWFWALAIVFIVVLAHIGKKKR